MRLDNPEQYDPDKFCWLLPAILIVVSVLIALSGCAGPAARYEAGKFYAKRLQFEVNKAKGVGTLVCPIAPKYEIRVESEADLDFLLLRSCGREKEFEKEGSSFKYLCTPGKGVEDNRPCPLSFESIEKGENRRPAGVVAFEDPARTLPATLTCNGEVIQAKGVGLCQNGASLITRVVFEAPVDVATGRDETGKPLCALPISADGKIYEWAEHPRGNCDFLFRERPPASRSMILYTFGYDMIQKGGG